MSDINDEALERYRQQQRRDFGEDEFPCPSCAEDIYPYLARICKQCGYECCEFCTRDGLCGECIEENEELENETKMQDL